MNIHLVNDEKFINSTIIEFEKHYPGENVFFVDISNKPNCKKLKYVDNSNHNIVFVVDFSNRKSLHKIENFCNGDVNVIAHSLCNLKANISQSLKKKYNITTYWICNGADLYGKLMIYKKYELFDYNANKYWAISVCGYLLKNILHSFKLRVYMFGIQKTYFCNLDFFCTWNNFDFTLFKKHYTSNASLKSFHYPTAIGYSYSKTFVDTHKEVILVNQSASKSGNHITVLKKILEIDRNKKIKTLIVPLSYGAENIKKSIKAFGYSNLRYCFKPLDNYMNINEYFNILKNVKSAVFGQRRQEAANNILFLLGLGAKVFLRKDNNLLQYFKSKGFFIYEFENELNILDDFDQLDIEKQQINRRLVEEEMSFENIELEFKALFSKTTDEFNSLKPKNGK